MSLSRSRTLPLLVAMASLGAAAAQAQSAQDGRGHWTLGIGATWSPSPYRSYDNKAWPLPLVNYEGKSFYFRGASLGYRLYSAPSDEISLMVSPLANRFRHDDSHDARLRRLSDRDISGLGGVAWKHTADWGVVQASAQKEFTGHGGGTSVDASYAYPIRKGALTLTPTVGVTRASGALNDYYYGVSGREAARSGLPGYRAGAGTAPWLGMAAMYRLSPKWITAAGFRYTVLPDEVKHSPMVGEDHTQSFFLSLSHVF